MKTKYVLFSTVMFLMMTIFLFGQTTQIKKSETIIKKNEISNLIGKPVFEITIDSLDIKAWIISQNKYKDIMKINMGKMMGQMKDKNMKMDMETKNAMSAGTHYFIFNVTNINNRKAVEDTSAKVEIVSVTKKMYSVVLRPMMNHLGSGITLDEKGKYLFTINLNLGNSYKTLQFKYGVK